MFGKRRLERQNREKQRLIDEYNALVTSYSNRREKMIDALISKSQELHNLEQKLPFLQNAVKEKFSRYQNLEMQLKQYQNKKNFVDIITNKGTEFNKINHIKQYFDILYQRYENHKFMIAKEIETHEKLQELENLQR